MVAVFPRLNSTHKPRSEGQCKEVQASQPHLGSWENHGANPLIWPPVRKQCFHQPEQGFFAFVSLRTQLCRGDVAAWVGEAPTGKWLLG